MNTLSFPASQIPILGEHFRLAGWFPTVLIVCQCEAKSPIMLPLGAMSQCPACRRGYSVSGYTAQAGNVQFGINVITPDGDEQLVKKTGIFGSGSI